MQEKKNQFFELVKAVLYTYVVFLVVLIYEIREIDFFVAPKALFGMFYYSVVPLLSVNSTWPGSLVFLPACLLMLYVNKKTKNRLNQFTFAVFLTSWVLYGRYCSQVLLA